MLALQLFYAKLSPNKGMCLKSTLKTWQDHAKSMGGAYQIFPSLKTIK